MDITKSQAANFILGRSHIYNKFKSLKQYFKKFHVVQVDPLNVVARNQELVLWNRVEAFRRKNLEDALYSKKRFLFEHWLQLYSIIDVEMFPYLQILRKNTDSHRIKFERKHRKEIELALDYIASREGSANAKNLAHIPAVSSFLGWKDGKSQKALLEYLWDAGYITISHRQSNHKLYDLTENLLPKNLIEKKVTRKESMEYIVRSYFDYFGILQQSTFNRVRKDLRKEVKEEFKNQVNSGVIQQISIEKSKQKYFISKPDWDSYQEIELPMQLRILAPLDPIVWDRQLLLDIFGLFYRWEVYTPPKKRIVGYYNMPVLLKDEMVGQVALRKDKNGVLQIENIVWENKTGKKDKVNLLKDEINKLQNFIDAD